MTKLEIAGALAAILVPFGAISTGPDWYFLDWNRMQDSSLQEMQMTREDTLKGLKDIQIQITQNSIEDDVEELVEISFEKDRLQRIISGNAAAPSSPEVELAFVRASQHEAIIEARIKSKNIQLSSLQSP